MDQRSRGSCAILGLLLLVATSCSSPHVPASIDLLQRHPVHTTTIQGYRLAYLDEGTGPPIILIHGFGGSMWQWEHQQRALAESYRVLTIDLLGSGLSDKPDLPYSPTFLLDTFRMFMDNLQIPRATIMGNSMGAGVAIGMALEHPERVKSLVLIAGFPAKIIESIKSPRYRQFVQNRLPIWLAKLGIWFTGRWTTELILEEIIHDHDRISPRVVERSHRNRSKAGYLHPLYSQIEQIPEWEKKFAPRLAEIPHPTFILWGAHDKIFPPSVGHTMHRTIPNSSFLAVPNAGHIPQWENPDFVNPALLQFLASQEKQQG